VVSAIVVELVKKHRAPADQIESVADEVGLRVAESQPEMETAAVDDFMGEDIAAGKPAEPDGAAQPLASEPEKLFDVTPTDLGAARRSQGV
jgi:hypothetical protein